MTPEQFVYWVSGFVSGFSTTHEKDNNVLKNLQRVLEEVKLPQTDVGKFYVCEPEDSQ